MILFIFTNDIRLQDNYALKYISDKKEDVIVCYFIEDRIRNFRLHKFRIECIIQLMSKIQLYIIDKTILIRILSEYKINEIVMSNNNSVISKLALSTKIIIIRDPGLLVSYANIHSLEDYKKVCIRSNIRDVSDEIKLNVSSICIKSLSISLLYNYLRKNVTNSPILGGRMRALLLCENMQFHDIITYMANGCISSREFYKLTTLLYNDVILYDYNNYTDRKYIVNGKYSAVLDKWYNGNTYDSSINSIMNQLKLTGYITYEQRIDVVKFINANYSNEWQNALQYLIDTLIDANEPNYTLYSSVTGSSAYYINKNSNNKSIAHNMRSFHNSIKLDIIRRTCKVGGTLIDLCCGRIGDLHKWISMKLSLVIGIDKSLDNINEAYYRLRESNSRMKVILFNGDSGLDIKSGSFLLSEPKANISEIIPCDVSSCQFAIHYFFGSLDDINGFVRNVYNYTKVGGYFICTMNDGKLVFDLLKDKDSVSMRHNNIVVCSIVKKYSHLMFKDDESSIGYQIDVYQASIGQSIPEYLVNFSFLCSIMKKYRFILIESALFSTVYKHSKKILHDYEKAISFLNRYAIFKKVE